jgi:hypothetical protein
VFTELLAECFNALAVIKIVWAAKPLGALKPTKEVDFFAKMV